MCVVCSSQKIKNNNKGTIHIFDLLKYVFHSMVTRVTKYMCINIFNNCSRHIFSHMPIELVKNDFGQWSIKCAHCLSNLFVRMLCATMGLGPYFIISNWCQMSHSNIRNESSYFRRNQLKYDKNSSFIF